MAAASKPLSNGSSEKYSKLRPHKGLRLMFIAGPSTTSTPCERASPAQGLTDLPDQRRIPGRGKRNSRREAGRREASTKTQVVGVLVVLDPQPVWSVRQT